MNDIGNYFFEFHKGKNKKIFLVSLEKATRKILKLNVRNTTILPLQNLP